MGQVTNLQEAFRAPFGPWWSRIRKGLGPAIGRGSASAGQEKVRRGSALAVAMNIVLETAYIRRFSYLVGGVAGGEVFRLV